MTVIGVNVDKKREDADKFLDGTPANFTVAYDLTGKVAEAYQPKGMPTSFLIGPDGGCGRFTSDSGQLIAKSSRTRSLPRLQVASKPRG